MDREMLFDDYFGEFREKDRVWEMLATDEIEGGEPQLLFDLKSYCLTQRLFFEVYSGDPEGRRAVLTLFPLPAVQPSFRERMRRMLSYSWHEIWIRHRRELWNEYETDRESRRIFLWSLIREAEDYTAWMEGLEDSFVRKSAQDRFPALAALIRSCANGFMTTDQLMAELREDGFAPNTPYYQKMENLIRQLVGERR